MTKIFLTTCTTLTVLLHFVLPYAALAQQSRIEQSSHAPPPYMNMAHHEAEHDTEHEVHEELPPHIEPEENELEELDESDTEVITAHNHVDSLKKTPEKAVFVYPKESGLCGAEIGPQS